VYTRVENVEKIKFRKEKRREAPRTQEYYTKRIILQRRKKKGGGGGVVFAGLMLHFTGDKNRGGKSKGVD